MKALLTSLSLFYFCCPCASCLCDLETAVAEFRSTPVKDLTERTMNVIQSAANILNESKKDAKQKAPSVNFYRESPNFELTLDEFEVFALKRLKVRRI